MQKTLEKINITGEISDPLNLFENLNILKESMSQFKKSVKEVERLLQELKSCLAKEYQELESQKDTLIKKTTSEKDIDNKYDEKIKEIEERIEKIKIVLAGEATFYTYSGNSKYEMNVETGEYLKLEEYEPYTELVGWDREEVEKYRHKEINKPSPQIIYVSNMRELPVELNDEKGTLLQNQKELIKEMLEAMIVQSQKEIDEIPNQAKEEKETMKINENKIKEFLEKLKILRDRNGQIFPDLHSVKLKKKK
jgi:septal ring factor EnvC (AmiA/AmiB activator)